VYIIWVDSAHCRARLPDLAEDFQDHYSCSYQSDSGDKQSGEDAESPELHTLDEALDWAHERAPEYVFVRPQWDPSRQFVAGDRPPATWQLFEDEFIEIDGAPLDAESAK
jgi:hypothetical protein